MVVLAVVVLVSIFSSSYTKKASIADQAIFYDSEHV